MCGGAGERKAKIKKLEVMNENDRSATAACDKL